MRLVIIYVVMGILSLFLTGFGLWTFNQITYNEKIRKSFLEKSITEIKNLKDVANLSDKTVLIKGKIIADETFLSKNKKKVILERYQEESKGIDKKWKISKDLSFFKVSPFKLKDSANNTVLIDPYDIDKTFLGKPEEVNEDSSDIKIKKSYWTLEPGQTVYILGNIENKSGTLIIDSPNLYKSISSSLLDREPFIVTPMEKTETANKAIELGKSLYYASMSLFAVGIFFIINSISNIAKVYKKQKNDF